MRKATFAAGAAIGYVFGTRAGERRYRQIAAASRALWQSKPVQKQVGNAKQAARTKAAPAVADLVADAARSTAHRLRRSPTVSSTTITSGTAPRSTPRPAAPAESSAPRSPGEGRPSMRPTTDPWASAVRDRIDTPDA